MFPQMQARCTKKRAIYVYPSKNHNLIGHDQNEILCIVEHNISFLFVSLWRYGLLSNSDRPDKVAYTSVLVWSTLPLVFTEMSAAA
jgi:hypothetical protein